MKNYTNSYNYLLDPECGPKEFIEAMKKIENLEMPMYYKSEEASPWKVSKKLVGSTFKDHVINSSLDQAVYFYSKNCHGCKKFGHHFEEIAVASMMNPPDTPIGFNRINSMINHLGPDLKNFHSTPIFSLYKRQCKTLPPVVYKQPYFTPELLNDFYKVSVSWEPIPASSLTKLFSDELLNRRSVLSPSKILKNVTSIVNTPTPAQSSPTASQTSTK